MTLANWITLIRFFLAPLIYWQLTTTSPGGLYVSFGLLAVSAISDAVDGWVARARNEVSELGKVLDPLGDKLVIFATLIALAVRWKLPPVLVGVYFLKELTQVLAGVFLLKKFNRVIPANWWGKSSTIAFFTGFALFFINYYAGLLVIGAAILLSIIAFYSYYRIYRKEKDN